MRRLLPAALMAAVLLPVGSTHLVPAAAGAAPPAARATATTLSPLPASSTVGTTILVRGTAPKGAVVVVQRRYVGGTFARIGTAKAGPGGKWLLRVPLVRGGTTYFRIARGGLTSQARSLPVYQWLDVATQPQVVQSDGIVGANLTVRMAEKAYPRSYTAPPGGALRVLVSTGGLCTRAQAWTGFRAGDQPGANERQFLNIGAYSGNGPTGNAEASPGQVRRVNLEIPDVDILSFEAQGANRTGGSDTPAVLASPRVLCNLASLPQPS